MPKQKARTPTSKSSARQKETAKAPDENHAGGGASANGVAILSNGHAVIRGQTTDKSAEIAEKIKELVRLAQEQGYLTYNDVNDALPDTLINGEELDEVYVKLRNLEVEIVDQAEVDRVKQAEPEEEEDKVRLDILDDPVRMYLKQMGQVT